MKLKFKGNVVIENREQLEEVGSLLEPSDMGWEYEKEQYGNTYDSGWQGEYGVYMFRTNHTTKTITILEVL